MAWGVATRALAGQAVSGDRHLVAPFPSEMPLHGFREANTALLQLNKTLGDDPYHGASPGS